MKQLLNREKREQGMSLSELFVVLGVTVVLAIILMPAIASNGDPERAKDIMSVAAVPLVIEAPRRSHHPSEIRRSQRRENTAEEIHAPVVEPEDSADTQDTEQLREGMVELLTTDVLRRHRR